MKRMTAVVILGLVIVSLCGCDDSTQIEEAWRRETEAREDAEQERDRWQLFTILAACAGGVLLVVGAGMGSASRKDAERLREEEQLDNE